MTGLTTPPIRPTAASWCLRPSASRRIPVPSITGAPTSTCVRADGRGRLRRLTRSLRRGSKAAPIAAPPGPRTAAGWFTATTAARSGSTAVEGAARSAPLGAVGTRYSPAWSVRGRIAFSLHNAIYTMRPDGSRRRRVVAGWDPDWSPDGRTLVYQVRGKAALALIRPDGRRRRILTADGAQPAFSPDGKYIVFERPAFADPANQRARDEIVVMRLRDRRTQTISTAPPTRPLPNAPFISERHSLYRPTWQPLRRRR